ncbi:Hypp796 [Branchiostoma lanceolatum]|uniref:Hypp796 protein n=1 Tax=Branchiostoma lanceolatum TaxID=7740 RepID=A0A8J9YKC2_BRALA|nr:Hypp796 [Branchiostoma lanceolatum]
MLDLFITNVHGHYHVPDIIAPLGSSDHNCILWKPNVSNNPRCKQPRAKHRLVTQERKDALGLCMGITDWSTVYNSASVEDKVATFNKTLQTMLDVCVPPSKSKTRDVDKHWITNKIKVAVRKRQSVYRKHGKTEKWKKLRNWVQSLIRKQKKNHYNRCIGMLKKNNPREWWNFVNNELGRTQKSKGNVTVTDVPDDRVADTLNDFFAEAWSDSRTFNLFPLPLPSSSDDLCSIGQVKAVLRRLNTRKSGGPDDIPNWVLSAYCEDLAPVVTHLINFSYNTGNMPSLWKTANVCPIPKTPAPASKKDWRPISLISTLGKVQERLVLNKFLPIMKPWIRDQYAYMPKSSTTVALLKAYQSWLQGLDTKKASMVRVLLADMSKAFDRVDHGILLQLLAVRGTPSKMLAWINSYLSGRAQRVIANNQCSSWRYVTSGVPQGGVLSPYLFLVYMSSRTTRYETTDNNGYADDIGLSRTIPCADVEADNTMQEETAHLDSWAAENNMIMNGDKSFELRMCFAKTPPEPPPLILGGKEEEVPVVTCATYLGFKVHSNLGWDSQITHVTKKGSRRLHFLRLLAKGGMPPEDLLTVYTTLVRPVLEYAHVLYVGCTVSQRNTLEAVQRRALRIINRNSSSPTPSPLPTLQSRREEAARALFTQMRANDHPLHYMITNDRKEETGRTLRNHNHLSMPKCRTERLKRSFLYQATLLHNKSL